MGLALPYFYSLTPREFQNHVAGYRRKQESDFRNGWEQTRQIMWAVMGPHQKNPQFFTPQKAKALPWDNEETQAEALHDTGDISESVKRWEERDRRRAEKAARGEITEKKILGKQ